MTLVYVCVCFHYLMVTIVTPTGPGVQKQFRAYTSSISFLIASRRIPSPTPWMKEINPSMLHILMQDAFEILQLIWQLKALGCIISGRNLFNMQVY